MSLGGDIMEEYYEKEILPEYKELLKECLRAFNELENTRIGSGTTYELAAKIEKLLKLK